MNVDRRRGTPRIRPPLSVHAEFADSEKTLAHGVLVDLSDSGARLVTNVAVASGRWVQVKLRPSREDMLITGAQIVWSAEGIELPEDLVGVRHGIRFVASAHGSVPILKLLQRFRWSPPNGQSSFDALIDPDIEALFVEAQPVLSDSFQDLCDSLLPYTDRLVQKLRYGRR